MSDQELFACWDMWLLQAQATNELDRYTYSHGVFVIEPGSNEKSKGGSGEDSRVSPL